MPIYFNFTTFPLPHHILITNSPTSSPSSQDPLILHRDFPCAKLSFRCLTILSIYIKLCFLFSVPQCSASTSNFLYLLSISSDYAIPPLNLFSSFDIQITFMSFFTFYHIFHLILPLLTLSFIPNHCQWLKFWIPIDPSLKILFHLLSWNSCPSILLALTSIPTNLSDLSLKTCVLFLTFSS